VTNPDSSYPGVFGATSVPGTPVDATFRPLDGPIDDALVASVYVVPFIGPDACVVLGFTNGDRSVRRAGPSNPVS
jgi:hypothetical protein